MAIVGLNCDVILSPRDRGRGRSFHAAREEERLRHDATHRLRFGQELSWHARLEKKE